MTTFQLALLTIGQSPRPDMTQAITRALPPHVRVTERGVLDGLTRNEIESRFAPTPSSAPLITRLADGTPVTVDLAAMGQGLQEAVDRLERDGVDAIVVLCTGRFPALRSQRAWLVEPDLVVPAVVASLVGERALGIVAPMPSQVDMVMHKWAALPGRHAGAAASPYGPHGALVDAAIELRARGAQAIVLDCMGYTEAHRDAIAQEAFGLPVFVSAGVLASALRPLF